MTTLRRLMSLPAVFRLEELVRLGMTRSAAHTTVMRWAKGGLIAKAGPRAGVYFNLIRDRLGPANRLLEAAQKLYPSAVVVGPAVLHAHGLTTQRPEVVDVAVLKVPTLRHLVGVHFVKRPREWYSSHARGLMRAGKTSPFSIDSLSAEQAIEDARTHRDVWLPEVEDLETDGFVAVRRGSAKRPVG